MKVLAKRALLVVVTMSFWGSVAAQSDSLQKVKPLYFNSFVTGALIGCGNCTSGKDFTLNFTTIHGMRVSPGIKVGIGLGMDVYSD